MITFGSTWDVKCKICIQLSYVKTKRSNKVHQLQEVSQYKTQLLNIYTPRQSTHESQQPTEFFNSY